MMIHPLIPQDFRQDRYWRGTLYIFTNNNKLQSYFHYIDFGARTIDAPALKRASKGWSRSEKFMLQLALHLYNEINKIANFSDMDYLDPVNKQTALEAIKLRFAS